MRRKERKRVTEQGREGEGRGREGSEGPLRALEAQRHWIEIGALAPVSLFFFGRYLVKLATVLPASPIFYRSWQPSC